MTKDHSNVYSRALSHEWLTRFYDTFIKWTMPESTFKRELVQQAHVFSKQQILDLGCGTATLTILIKKMHSDANVIGLDGDRKILELGRRKAEKTKVDITLTQAMSFDLPYPDRFFDRVLSSLDA